MDLVLLRVHHVNDVLLVILEEDRLVVDVECIVLLHVCILSRSVPHRVFEGVDLVLSGWRPRLTVLER